MKTIAYKSAQTMIQMPYPNAATHRELFHKLLDGALVAASGMGIAAIVLLCLVL